MSTDICPLTVLHTSCLSSFVRGHLAEQRHTNMAALDQFMYFAFGSNLLRQRLQLSNPSAMFCCTARLKDYKLSFGLWKKHVENSWHGGVATIQFCPGAEVWGVVWALNNENLTSLDNQEGVREGIYSPLEVSVETDEGLMLCRTYQMKSFHACPPSPQYKQVVCLGAEENGLPEEYRKRLEVIQTNNYSGPSILDQIRTPVK
ncbi:gamma-glutamylcyclotransferase a [Paralichthys olivaceus]|uniref:gamma-glutamylcyclotransferase a n=1 Tax=Paralichthys olivaceus TaxID=8255 RepID=UPI00097CEC49|nr:PREDICTED: gamma-glutamylcyclotransferase-like [Paralichthys olivaceus]